MMRNAFSAQSMRRDAYQAKLGLFLFIGSLAVFFLAGLVLYGLVWIRSRGVSADLFSLPLLALVVSITAMVLTSVSLDRAVQNVRRERQRSFRRWLVAASIAALLFLLVQSYVIWALFALSTQLPTTDGRIISQVDVMSVLVFIHAMHVVGGMAAMAWVNINAVRGMYDHEKHWGVDMCATYWHFLDGVWLLMLALFLVAR